MKLLILIGIILIGFAIYTFLTAAPSTASLTVPSPSPVNTVQITQQPVIQEQVKKQEVLSEIKKERQVIQHAVPASNDEMSDNYRIAGEDDTFRHPENLFRPAPENNNAAIAVESGAASMMAHMQQYKPELVQNGGAFMDQIVPASAMNDDNYSSFN